MIDVPWNDVTSTIDNKTPNAYEIISSFDISKEKFSEESFIQKRKVLAKFKFVHFKRID